MTIAPTPHFPERPGNVYDRKVSPALAGQRGPLRFEEGLGTDTDVPNEFSKGAMQGYESASGRPNRNKAVYDKPAEETMRERTHVGSSAWVDSIEHLSDFSTGAFADHGDNHYEEVVRSGSKQNRTNAAVVQD